VESKRHKREAQTWAQWFLGVAFVMIVTSLWIAAPATKKPTLQVSSGNPHSSPSVKADSNLQTLNIEHRAPASIGTQASQSPAPRPFLARLISQGEALRKNGHPELASRLQESLEGFESQLHKNGAQARFSNSKIAKDWLNHPETGVEEITLILKNFEGEDWVSFRAELFQVLSLLSSVPGSDETRTTKQVATLAEQELLHPSQIPADLDLSESVSPQLALTTISFRLLISTARSELEAVEIGKRHIRQQSNDQVRESMIATLLSKYPDANEQ
jgi:hypothetical protein